MEVLNNVSMIAAVGKNNELGYENNLIWRIKEDLNFFKEYTTGKQMIMGYNTFYSLRGGKPLPLRKHVVLTKNHEIEENEQIYIVRSMNELLEYINEYQEEMVVIGGASLYRNMLEYTKKIILTEIDKESDSDAYFPEFNHEEWESETIYENHENDLAYKRKIYIRK